MKIDRRSFLSLSIGATAGITLSPLPWKLADDVTIWTQMWPWTPVPEDGEVTYVNSTCTLCPGGCGITVRKVNERVVKIEGMKGHPINDGGICLLGLSGPQLLYGPTRVKYPMKRTGNRGDNRWERIAWSEALSLVVEKLREIRENGQSHMVGGISGTEFGTVPQLMKRFLTAYGSPNFMTKPSIQDSYRLSMHMMQGTSANAGFDFENADYILSFGSGLLDGWGSPVSMFRANSTWQTSGSKLVQLESRLSKTAAKANKWIPINPGTEATLAMGIANVIVQKSLYNKDFLDQYASGFDDWKDNQGRNHRGFKQFVLAEFDPVKVETITGVKKSLIVSMAQDFARASKPIAVCGLGQGGMPGSLHTYLAIQALNAMVGNINRKGGVWSVPIPDHIQWSQIRMDAVAKSGIKQPRLDGAGSRQFPLSQSLLNRFFNTVRTKSSYPMQALFITNANPLYSMPDSGMVKKALDNIPFIVSFSSYMDETAQYADLILPNHTYLERWEDVPVTAGIREPVLGLTKPVVKPQFFTKHTGDVILHMAKQLGGSISDAFPWNNYEACLKTTLSDKWDSLKGDGFIKASKTRSLNLSGMFQTPSKKFEFIPTINQKIPVQDTESFPYFSAVKIQGDDTNYPLIFVPYDSIRLAHGFIGDPPFVMKTVPDTVLKKNDVFIEINPETAKTHRLREGKYAILETPVGRATVKIRLFDGIMPGVVALPRGLGHTAYDKFLAGKGINVNELISPIEDPVSGLDVAWGIRAKLTVS